MNAKIKLLAMMALMGSLNDTHVNYTKDMFAKRINPNHLRKKCKSCKSFPCHKNSGSPLNQACESYNKK